ncbi:MAG TPA: thioredoxin family protein [Polyangiaceae bacterium]|nr:thioredoxin family protein [Polyangiaceae bacterium]
MTNKSIAAAVIIAVGVVAVPLFLKSKGSATTIAPEGVQPSLPATGAPVTAKALPRFVDLGTTTCAPCKAMLGVMAELEQKYPGAMTIEFVNVQEQPLAAQRYGIQTIPTQIFYAPDGRELYRHIGVFRTEAIIAKWAELGFQFKPASGI